MHVLSLKDNLGSIEHDESGIDLKTEDNGLLIGFFEDLGGSVRFVLVSSCAPQIPERSQSFRSETCSSKAVLGLLQVRLCSRGISPD